MTDLALQNRFLVTATVAGVGALGAFMTFAGGDVSNDAQVDRPDGISPQSIAGPVNFANVTITRTFDIDRETAALLSQLDQAGRTHAGISVGKTPRDTNGNPKGRGRTYVGNVIRVKGADVDANSTDRATVEIEMQVSGVA
jgi:hypothetical protein